MNRIAAISILLCAFLSPFAFGEPDAKPAIERLKKVKTEPVVFKEATAKKPIVVKTAKEAAKYFGKDELAKVEKAVDFKKQMVLIFAWRGSGQDDLDVAVAESYPEQITFKLKRGRTRDLRPHFRVYALRSNVKWSAK